MISISTYLKAHVFGSTAAAASLASVSAAHCEYAHRLIEVKNAQAKARAGRTRDRLADSRRQLEQFGVTLRPRNSKDYIAQGRFDFSGFKPSQHKSGWDKKIIRLANAIERRQIKQEVVSVSLRKYDRLAQIVDRERALQQARAPRIDTQPP